MQTSTQFYLTHFLTEEPNEHAKNGDASHDRCEEDHGVPAGGRRCGRQMEVLDPASFAQRTQTLQRSAATPSPGEPANAYPPIAAVRTDGGASPADLGARPPKVEYTLSDLGQRSAPMLRQMYAWGRWCCEQVDLEYNWPASDEAEERLRLSKPQLTAKLTAETIDNRRQWAISVDMRCGF